MEFLKLGSDDSLQVYECKMPSHFITSKFNFLGRFMLLLHSFIEFQGTSLKRKKSKDKT